jgi:hypothetical protein
VRFGSSEDRNRFSSRSPISSELPEDPGAFHPTEEPLMTTIKNIAPSRLHLGKE